MKILALKYLAPAQIMTLLKLCIYAGICYNGYGFITDDFKAATALLDDSSSLSQITNIFAATMDTLAWITLLIVFELETSILADSTLRKKQVKWPLHSITAFCYFFVLYAFTAYLGKLMMLSDATAYTLGDPCGLVNTAYVITPILDDYFPITLESCQALNPATMGQIVDQPIVFENSNYGTVTLLAWVDVTNSVTWLLVVALLQMNIILQLKGLLTTRIMKITAFFKVALYLTLFTVAVIWGIYGKPEDFFDAVLWLLGFMIIELNIFNWNQEVEEEHGQQPAPRPAQPTS